MQFTTYYFDPKSKKLFWSRCRSDEPPKISKKCPGNKSWIQSKGFAKIIFEVRNQDFRFWLFLSFFFSLGLLNLVKDAPFYYLFACLFIHVFLRFWRVFLFVCFFSFFVLVSFLRFEVSCITNLVAFCLYKCLSFCWSKKLKKNLDKQSCYILQWVLGKYA